ncbi:MAG TPA: hypothetical protein VJL81_00430 [Solirubrobacterales bacterium]|nr:hypothetical protein [Solirubrobacterales bacterium]
MYRTGPLVAAIVTVLALAACGGGSASSTETVTSKTLPPKVVVATPKKSGPATGDCQKQLGEFVGRMTDLRQSLLAGLSYAEYVVRVRAIRDAYEAVPVKKLDAPCLNGPASDAEDAFNQYLRAANTWGECAGTAGCAASEIEGKLQRRWRIASKSLDKAKQD